MDILNNWGKLENKTKPKYKNRSKINYKNNEWKNSNKKIINKRKKKSKLSIVLITAVRW